MSTEHQYRIRLTDDELDLICRALRARAAGVSTKTAMQLLMLADRLDIRQEGNPNWAMHGGGIDR